MPRKITALGFVAALLCFLFPFVQVSCGGNRIFAVTGTQLMTGFEAGPPKLLQVPNAPKVKTQHIKPNGFVIAAFAAGVLALLLAFGNDHVTAALAAMLGCAGTVALLIFQQSGGASATDVTRQSAGMITIDYLPAFWAAVVLLGGSGIAVFASVRAPAEPAPSVSTAATVGAASVCAQCGRSSAAGTAFCGACGSRL